jgi:hypothetical protein
MIIKHSKEKTVNADKAPTPDDVLRRMLATPPDPHKKSKKKSQKKK